MCHYGSAFHDGTVPDMIASANWNKVVTEQMCAIYRDRMIKSKWAIDKYGTPTERQVRMFLNKKLKDGDWYLFGDEIVNHGFADEVFA
jgi:ATP-dependent protease ClpP protease subunit